MKILAAVLISATIMVTGCKKAKDGKDGTQGPQGPAGIVTTSTDGYIKGTITGTHRDGTSFSNTFNYTNYWFGPSATLDSTTTGYVFTFERGTSLTGSDDASFMFSVNSLTATTATLFVNNFVYTQSMSGNRMFEFTLNGSSNGSITGLTYNQSTGLLKGNYSVTSSGLTNNSGNSATIVGSFEVTATKLYYYVNHVPVHTKIDKQQ